jgi:hypothetical protein
MRAMGTLEFINQLSEGKKCLPLWLHGVTPLPQQPTAPSTGMVVPSVKTLDES